MVTDSKQRPLTVYKASAGSGKTFTLATEYIRLVVENPQSYRNILAVTFTNKATEEMKMRILSQLYGIWKQLPESASYTKVICERLGQSERFVSERSGIALHNLIHNYSDFRVMTIDTFFQSVLRNLARELDLTANLRIGLNDIQVEELAVDQLIENLDSFDKLLQWLMKYILENISDDKGWNVIGQIKQFGRTIFSDEYKSVSQRLQEKLEEPDFFNDYTERLKTIRQEALEKMKAYADTFFNILEDNGLTESDFAFGRTGLCSFFFKLRDGVFDESILGKRVTDSLGNPEKWYKKTHPQKETIHMLVEQSLNDLLYQAVEDRPKQWRRYKSADLTLRHLNQLRLLGSIEKTVRTLNEEANRFLLSDTQQLLHALIDGSDSPFIFEKIGTQLEHVMIDEFQDTSTVQWQNFKVLLNEAMSHQQTGNLIVGDVKQSIYRWRSGDWRLLNDITQQFPNPGQQLDIRTLDTNYRSQANIIAFNNAFFKVATQLEYMALGDSSDAEQLKRAYADVEQKTPEGRETVGLVNISLLPPDDYQEQVLQQLADTVLQLIENGATQSQIAILVRTNALIPLIADYFMQHYESINIISDEAFRLDASSAVCMIVESLRLLSHPDDQLTRANIVKHYQHCVRQQQTPDEDMLFSTRNLNELLPDAFVTQTDELLTLPLYELADRLYAIFSLDSLSEQSAYICTFFDHLADYVNDNGTDINGFLHEWEENLCSKTIQSSEQEGIRLISIHKSKGLEFAHVIIPFCDWQLEKQTGNILWCQPKEEPFNELPLAPIDYSQKQMTGTIYEADYHQEHLQNTVDNLNLLYVAFTRAKHNLFVIGKRMAKNTRSVLLEQSLPSVAELLPDALLEGTEDEQACLTFSFGTLSIPRESKTYTTHYANPFTEQPDPQPVNMKTYTNKVNFRQSNRSKAFVESEEDEDVRTTDYIKLGSVLHQVFSTIRTSADIEHALWELQQEGILYDDQLTSDRIMTLLRKRLADPRVADWFSNRWKLFNECTILTIENDKVMERRPDRVMTDGTRWLVVDFKFGSPKAEHQAQVKEYMELLSSMGHQNIEGYLWYVYSNKIVEVK